MPTPAGKKRVVLLGATGSIGENALRVIAAHRDKLELVGIAARSNWEKLAAIAREFGVKHVGVFDDVAFGQPVFPRELVDRLARDVAGNVADVLRRLQRWD